MAAQIRDRVLSPLIKPSRNRPTKEWYYDKRIKHQLDLDEQRCGPITQANMHNRERCPLLSLPAELRSVIWELAMTPYLEHAAYYSGYRPRPKPEYTPSVDIFCRTGRAYPDIATVLTSRMIYEETRAMYTSIVSRFYQETPLHLQSNGFTDVVRSSFSVKISSPRSMRQQIDSLKDGNVQHINDFMIYHPKSEHSPQLLFNDGTWRGRWKAYASPDPDGFVVRYIVLYQKSKRSAIDKILQKNGRIRYERLRNGRQCGSPHRYDYDIEALLVLQTPSLDEVIEDLTAVCGFRRITREVIMAMLYIQAYTSSRYS